MAPEVEEPRKAECLQRKSAGREERHLQAGCSGCSQEAQALRLPSLLDSDLLSCVLDDGYGTTG